MGLFSKSTSKQTAKVKSLVKLTAARLAVARRPRLGRRSIARGDVGQLLAIGRLDRALLRAEQVIDEDNMLEALDMIELYCKIVIEQASQLDNPKECGEEIKAAAAGLMFASARLGELPELLDARAILADKFGHDFARAAKEGSPGVVDPTLVKKLSGARATLEETRRLAKEIAAENDILLDFPENPVVGIRQNLAPVPQSAQTRHAAPVKERVEQSEVKADRHEAQGRQQQRFVASNARPGLAQLAVEDKVSRESKKYLDARMAAEAAFESATFAAMAARAAVELSRSQTQGKGPTGGGGSFYKVHPHPVQSSAQKSPSPSPSPSWSDRSTVTSIGSDAAQKGKGVAWDQSAGEEDIVWPPQPQRRPTYQRAGSAMVTGGGAQHGEVRMNGAAPDSNPMHSRRSSELAGGNARAQGGQYMPPPYRRASTGAATAASHPHAPYARIASALEGGKNEHIARHEEVRRMGTDSRVLQERVYGAAPVQGHAPMNPERRANSVRTRS